uniref:RRM domain-containing protein n=1 Tax=Leptobrachium leishanense TaxID=445787 RepID=A0A8C5WDW6_9ANUR
MSVIIRLRGLPVEADSMDIRNFFYGLSIPRGGVYIIGGNYGEAYIAFGNIDDARCALSLSGHPLKNSSVHLTLSSEGEMNYAFEMSQMSATRPQESAPYPLMGNMPERNGMPSYRPLGPGDLFSAGPSYIHLQGLPLKATKVDIKEHFRGIMVEDAVFLKFQNGIRNGKAIVKFKRRTDAKEALECKQLFMGTAYITMMPAHEVVWIRECERLGHSPTRSLSAGRLRDRSRSPVRMRRHAVYTDEFYVHLVHLPVTATKKEIQQHFSFARLADYQISFLTDKSGKRAREGFAMFKHGRDYRRALDLHKEPFQGRPLSVYAIPKRAMEDILSHKERSAISLERPHNTIPRRNSKDTPSWKANCVYLRNFSFDVTKADVQKFLVEFPVSEKDIFVLSDDKGVGLGEALVRFPTEKEAANVGKLHREKYNGTEILLRCITEEQMKAFGVGAPGAKGAGVPSTAVTSEAKQVSDSKALSTSETPEVSTSGNHSADTSPSNPPDQSALQSSDMVTDQVLVPDSSETAEEVDISEMAAASDTEMESTNPKDESAVEPDLEETNEETNEDITCDNSNDAKPNEVTVFVRNVPSTVTVEEILAFFSSYKADSVNLTQIDTGTATVCMQTYEEALCAVNELDNQLIGMNTVVLSLT